MPIQAGDDQITAQLVDDEPRRVSDLLVQRTIEDFPSVIELPGWKPGRSGPGGNPSGLSVEGCTLQAVGR